MFVAFDEFWAIYPRKVGKRDAGKVWSRLKVTPELFEKMKATLAWQIEQPQWKTEGGQFIPHPATWLRQGRWDDEPTEVRTLTRKERLIQKQGYEY